MIASVNVFELLSDISICHYTRFFAPKNVQDLRSPFVGMWHCILDPPEIFTGLDPGNLDYLEQILSGFRVCHSGDLLPVVRRPLRAGNLFFDPPNRRKSHGH